MNEVLNAIEKIKGEDARRKILQGIVKNELTKPVCRQIAQELLDDDRLYRTRTLEQQEQHRNNNK